MYSNGSQSFFGQGTFNYISGAQPVDRSLLVDCRIVPKSKKVFFSTIVHLFYHECKDFLSEAT